MSVKHKVITIDGPAGTGKSTVARGLAEALHFSYFDTGALYRAITWKVLQERVQLDDQSRLDELLVAFTFHINEGRYFVGDDDVTRALRTKEVTAHVSEVAALSKVRERLKPIQIAVSKETDAVFEGRDLGTVVFPHADLKFFLTARAEVRAKRRLKELEEKFPEQTFSFEKILSEIQERDRVDSNRRVAPLK
ncbi:MAG: Cytidylate kinase, partial [Chlamydiae bacterium]|nr:Cytidylate kinase [Chlamydiota bacterium]